MDMLNPYCGVDRDPRGVVRLTICNAGSLNIRGSAAINGVREGLEALATESQIRVLVIAGQSEKSMIGGADIKEMAKLDQASAEKFITGLRDLCEAVLPRLIGWGRARWLVMTAENIDAATALAWGLVDTVAPEGGLDAAVERTIKALL